MEHNSDLVMLGKMIHETSYGREHKEIELENIKLDWCDLKDGILHEVKKDDTVEEAHQWQVLYYLYYLKLKGIKVQTSANQSSENIIWKGEIDYPKLKKREEVFLTQEKEEQMIEILKKIEEIVTKQFPPKQEPKFSLCKRCSYAELCHS